MCQHRGAQARRCRAMQRFLAALLVGAQPKPATHVMGEALPRAGRAVRVWGHSALRASHLRLLLGGCTGGTRRQSPSKFSDPQVRVFYQKACRTKWGAPNGFCSRIM